MTNLAVVQSLYEAFAKRDRDAILAVLHSDAEWIQNQGFPGGGRHVGAEHIVDDVLGRFSREWSEWKAVVREYLEAGDAILVLGEYVATHKQVGKRTTAAFAHVYWVQSDRITRFEQYTDTQRIVAVMP